MTLDNIANGEPMAVYNGSSEVPMFLGITLNNVMVSFNCFAMGLLTSFGTGYMLLSNGIMVGAFQTFFYQHDLLWESSLAIWLHGTLEIWAIIVAGAAGLALGNGWLFSRHVFTIGIFQKRSEARLENSDRHCSGIYYGRLYRRFYYPSHRTSRYVEARCDTHFSGIYYILLYLFTK